MSMLSIDVVTAEEVWPSEYLLVGRSVGLTVFTRDEKKKFLGVKPGSSPAETLRWIGSL